jgi:hypothetical protein
MTISNCKWVMVSALVIGACMQTFGTAISESTLAAKKAAPREDGCRSVEECLAKQQADQWNRVTAAVIQKSKNLADAQSLLSLAKQSTNDGPIQEASEALKQAQNDWQYWNSLANTLTSSDYKTYLKDRELDLAERYDQAMKELHERSQEFARLNKALQQGNQAALKTMEDAAREQNSQVWTLAFDSTVATLETTAHVAGHLVGQVNSPELRAALIKYAHLIIAAPVAAAAHDAAHKDLVAAFGHLALVALPMVSGALTGGANATVVGGAGPTAAGLVVAVDLLDVARNHYEFGVAQEQQTQTLRIEAKYQFEIYRLGEVANMLRTEKTRAHDAIRHAEAFEKQVDSIRSQLSDQSK